MVATEARACRRFWHARVHTLVRPRGGAVTRFSRVRRNDRASRSADAGTSARGLGQPSIVRTNTATDYHTIRWTLEAVVDRAVPGEEYSAGSAYSEVVRFSAGKKARIHFGTRVECRAQLKRPDQRGAARSYA